MQVFKSENTLTGCKVPTLLNASLKPGYVETIRPRDNRSVNIEYKLYQYSKNANIKTCDRSKFQSEADDNFRRYVDGHISSLTE